MPHNPSAMTPWGEASFWSRVDRRSPDECWRWTGPVDKNGYGRAWHRGQSRPAHRVAWELVNGKTPADCVCHSCGDACCVNPAHLQIKKQSEKQNGPKLEPLEQRFWRKVDKAGPNECWLWKGTLSEPNGYGLISNGHNKPWLRAHRVSWQLANGRDPGDLFVCHSCDNRTCVNPAHLWLGTNTDNLKDMVAKGRHINQRKTHCPSGHEYSAENTRLYGRGYRRCIECTQARGRLRMRAIRAAAKASNQERVA